MTTRPEAGPELAPDRWDEFVSAKTANERCQAWLSLVCTRINGAQGAAVLVENLDDRSFVPMAVWPHVSTDLGRLAAVVEAALRERRGVVMPAPAPSPATHIAYPVRVDERIAAVVAIEILGEKGQVDDHLREIHWGSAWLANLLAGRELSEMIRSRERVDSVLDATAVILRHGKLHQALFDLANTLRQRFACARVAIGLANRQTVKLTALSEAASFDRHSPLVKAYEQAMAEAFDVSGALASPSLDRSADGSAPKHDELRQITGAGSALSFPLAASVTCCAVLTLERQSGDFSGEDLLWLDAFAALAAPIIEQRRAAERSAFSRLLNTAQDFLEKIFGPGQLIWKTASASVVVLTALLILLPVGYRVGAKTVIEGEVQRVAAAPFEGFVGAAFVRAGDSVEAGQLLAQLDDRELRIEEAKWSNERDQYDNRWREASATHDLTAMQIIGAQLRQSEAQLALVTEKIARAQIKAPFDGIVVSGDLSQEIGAPVETGKKLFEIAPLHSYRVILQVDEREIRHVAMGQRGRLVMTGIASEAMDFTVAKVTPVATAQDGKNFFRVEAALAEASPRLRPGMEGVGKIEVGRRSLWWVLTHSLSDWLLLSLWTWMP